jgi:hypothetical protein
MRQVGQKGNQKHIQPQDRVSTASCMYQPVTTQTSCRRDNLRYEPYPQLPKCIIEHANVTQLHVLGYYSTIKKWIRAGVQQLKTIKRLVVEVDCSWDAGTLSSDYLDRDLGITGVELGVNADGNREWLWEVPKKKNKDEDNDNDDDTDGDDAVLKCSWSVCSGIVT